MLDGGFGAGVAGEGLHGLDEAAEVLAHGGGFGFAVGEEAFDVVEG